jgi:hypothetical protein
MWKNIQSVTFPEDIFSKSPLREPQISNVRVKVHMGKVVHKLRCDTIQSSIL